jgi:hypothetical protein
LEQARRKRRRVKMRKKKEIKMKKMKKMKRKKQTKKKKEVNQFYLKKMMKYLNLFIRMNMIIYKVL